MIVSKKIFYKNNWSRDSLTFFHLALMSLKCLQASFATHILMVVSCPAVAIKRPQREKRTHLQINRNSQIIEINLQTSLKCHL